MGPRDATDSVSLPILSVCDFYCDTKHHKDWIKTDIDRVKGT